MLQKGPKAKIEMDEFYISYKNWAGNNGFTMTQTAPTVRKNLEHMGFYVPRHRMGRVIKGLCVKALISANNRGVRLTPGQLIGSPVSVVSSRIGKIILILLLIFLMLLFYRHL